MSHAYSNPEKPTQPALGQTPEKIVRDIPADGYPRTPEGISQLIISKLMRGHSVQ